MPVRAYHEINKLHTENFHLEKDVSKLLTHKSCLEQTVDDLEKLYTTDLELLTCRLSDKDLMIRDLEARLYQSEQYGIDISSENTSLKNEIHYLNEQLHNVNSLKHVKPPRVYFRDGTSSFMGGGHTNRSKSTAIFESNEKIERPDDFLMGENERLRHILEEKERIIQELRREIDFNGHKDKGQYLNNNENFHEEIHRLEKYIEELEDKLKSRPNLIETNVTAKQKLKQNTISGKVKLVPHSFLEREIEEFEILPDIQPNHHIKEIHENDKSLLNAFLGLITYLREALSEILFEIFIRSANHAYHRKINSLILFIVNVKELKERTLKGLLIVLFLYRKMKKIIKLYLPDYGKIMSVNRKNYRSQSNVWIVDNIKEVISRKKYDKTNKNQVIFNKSLLAIKYRAKYPMKEKALIIDQDLKIHLENKICSSFLKIFAKEEPKIPNIPSSKTSNN